MSDYLKISNLSLPLRTRARTRGQDGRKDYMIPEPEQIDPEIIEIDPSLYAPDGEPWCRFGAGLECLNASRCLNPAHRGGVGQDEL